MLDKPADSEDEYVTTWESNLAIMNNPQLEHARNKFETDPATRTKRKK